MLSPHSSLGVNGIVFSERDADEQVEVYIVWMTTDLAALIKENIKVITSKLMAENMHIKKQKDIMQVLKSMQRRNIAEVSLVYSSL